MLPQCTNLVYLVINYRLSSGFPYIHTYVIHLEVDIAVETDGDCSTFIF